MNNKKICFIICCNNNQYTEQCMKYIHHLTIPEGYSIDVLTITEAESITSAYNCGMNASDAKYKVYLHQDTFIINKNFITDILNIFINPKIGMIGVVGSLHLPPNGMMWYGERVGRLYASIIYDTTDSNFMPDSKTTEYVEAIDGMIMITQYDLYWREDLFKNWHFYDLSQSLEFRKNGYQIVVPNTDTPWCLHDEGITTLNDYYEEREKFVNEYSSFLNSSDNAPTSS